MNTKAGHIAVILHDFATGGSERIAIRLANRWAQEGRRVTIICGTERGAARALVGPGVEVAQCSPETVRSPWSRMQLGWRMARLVRQYRPDIVFSPGNFHLIILAFLARQRFTQRPVFVSKLSNPIRRLGFRTRVEGAADALIRMGASPVDHLVAMSSCLMAEARSIFGADKVVAIQEPILEDSDEPVTPIQRLGEERLIICAARLAPQKDLMTTVQAFALVPKEERARLIILGEGPLRSTIEREVSRLGIGDRVEMPGHVGSIAPALAAADLYLMTSHYEGYPAVLIEAMAAGVPIVTTPCTSALSEILPDASLGIIVNSRSPADIARAIIRCLNEDRPTKRAAAPIIERHRIGASSRAYLSLFDQLVSARSRAAPVENYPSPIKSGASELC